MLTQLADLASNVLRTVFDAQTRLLVYCVNQDSSFKVDHMDQTLNVLLNVLLDSSEVLQEFVNLVSTDAASVQDQMSVTAAIKEDY